jgi:hypothetical protein
VTVTQVQIAIETAAFEREWLGQLGALKIDISDDVQTDHLHVSPRGRHLVQRLCHELYELIAGHCAAGFVPSWVVVAGRRVAASLVEVHYDALADLRHRPQLRWKAGVVRRLAHGDADVWQEDASDQGRAPHHSNSTAERRALVVKARARAHPKPHVGSLRRALGSTVPHGAL